MRLIKLTLSNFRRFAGTHSLDLNENLIALVGPNEGGKTSILHALDLLGRYLPPQQSDVTRDHNGPATIAGLYALDPEDRLLLEEIPQGPSVTHLQVQLSSNAEPAILPEPRPTRDLAARRVALASLEALVRDPAVVRHKVAKGQQPLKEHCATIQKALESTKETLPEKTIALIEALAIRLQDLVAPISTADTADTLAEDSGESALRLALTAVLQALDEVVRAERAPAPATVVGAVLRPRTPNIAVFNEAERQLESAYNIDKIADTPPAALANLCQVAGLDLRKTREALQSKQLPRLEGKFEAANATLKARFRETWKQSEVYPRLGVPADGTLRVLVATEGDGGYSYPTDRSDGLRWFLALHAFLVARGQDHPILLVDEAETHLHYDAQADLVDALMAQRVASKVVYTTHSVGCLPPDLGTGIRATIPEKGVERSRIVNSYWSVQPEDEAKIGYAPLVFAMGARLLALTIPRYGVVVEGPSDAILLPTLLREASGIEALRYRIVPGLSELSNDALVKLNHHAGQLLCLVDGDKAGNQLADTLIASGHPAEAILTLHDILANCTLEDLIDPAIFSDAVNSEIETWGLGALRITPSVLPPTGRWNWLQSIGPESATRCESLSKSRVAQRVVDLSRRDSTTSKPRRAAAEVHRAGLRGIHDRIVAAFDL